MNRARAIAAIVLGSQGIVLTPVEVPSQGDESETLVRVLRDCGRSLLWVVSGRTGASLNPHLMSVDHKLFPKGRSLTNFVVSDTFYQLLFKQVGRVSIIIAYKQVATELLSISPIEDKYLQQLNIFSQQLDGGRLRSV